MNKFRLAALGFALAWLTAAPVAAQSDEATIRILDPFAVILPGAMSGGIYLTIHNAGLQDDRLVGVRTDAAKRAELHMSMLSDDGISQMHAMPEGVVIPAGGELSLARGGAHIMLMGPTQSYAEGDMIEITLVFDGAEEITVTVPVDPRHKE